MKPLDWLRTKAAAAVRIGPAPLREPTPADLQRVAPLVVRAMEADRLKLETQQREHTANDERSYAAQQTAQRADVERTRREISTGTRTKPDWGEPLMCPCIAIYSTCVKTDKHQQ